MIVKALKTDRLAAGQVSLTELLDSFLPEFADSSVLAITSKVVSLCEGRVVPKSQVDKEELIKQESDFYLPLAASQFGYHFSINRHMLVSMGGIDESNAGDNYILWPADPQKTANQVRGYLKKRFGLKKCGVIITDSTLTPLRLGTVGTALAYSGFVPLKSYIGQPDLFGRKFRVSRSSIVGGLAAAAVLIMGEGTEQTPLAVLSDLPFVKFVDRKPTAQELKSLMLEPDEDVFGPILSAVKWLPGKKPS